MWFFIYDLIFFLCLVIYLPVYFWRRKINLQALLEKLGFISFTTSRESIWIQAVSVGEVNLIENLINKIKEVCDLPIVISTTTLTGNRIARKKYSKISKVIFLPFDISFILEKVLKIIKPKIFIAVETEIWPNLISRLNKKNIPIVIINGRISDKAFVQYKLIRPLMKKILAKYSHIGVQNTTYKERFNFLGADNSKVVVTGNMKFEGISIDSQSLMRFKERYVPILKGENSLVLLAASTHHPEEEIIISTYKDISQSVEGVNLVIAPRHPERTPAIEKIIKAKGFNPVRMSKANNICAKDDIFIIDTVGELLYFYAICDICFVGGSLSKDGGHNVLEPTYFRKPTIFGPNMSNFRDIEEVILEKAAGVKVQNKSQLKDILISLIKDKYLRENLSNKCCEVFQGQRKGLENNLKLILNILNYAN